MKKYGSSGHSNIRADLASHLLSALRTKFPEHFVERKPTTHIVDVEIGQDPDEAISIYQRNHPEAIENDIYIMSWLLSYQSDFEVRNVPGMKGSVYIPVDEVTTLDDRPSREEQVSFLPHEGSDTAQRTNLDYVIDAMDAPETISPQDRARVMKYGDVRRNDEVLMRLTNKKGRY